MLSIQNSKRYSMYEVARLIDVHVATIWRWSLNGVRGRKLKTFLVGGRRFVRASDLEAFLAGDNTPSSSDLDLEARAEIAGKLLDSQGVRTGSRRAEGRAK